MGLSFRVFLYPYQKETLLKKVFLMEALAVLVLAGIMVLLLYRKTPADVPLQDVNLALTENYALTDMEPAGDMRMKRAFSLNASDFTEYLYYAPDNTMSVNEILIIKCPDESQASNIRSAFESRLQVQKKNFDGYGTDQTALLEHARYGSDGLYSWFMVGPEADSWLKTAKAVWEGQK